MESAQQAVYLFLHEFERFLMQQDIFMPDHLPGLLQSPDCSGDILCLRIDPTMYGAYGNTGYAGFVYLQRYLLFEPPCMQDLQVLNSVLSLPSMRGGIQDF